MPLINKYEDFGDETETRAASWDYGQWRGRTGNSLRSVSKEWRIRGPEGHNILLLQKVVRSGGQLTINHHRSST